MSGVFRSIDPPPPSPPGECVPGSPLPLVRGEDTLAGWRGGAGAVVNSSEDARHCSVLICKYFVCVPYRILGRILWKWVYYKYSPHCHQIMQVSPSCLSGQGRRGWGGWGGVGGGFPI